MKIRSLLVVLLFISPIFSYSQFIHKIKADSVLITNDSCDAELNLENSTKNVNGFLYNKGNGRTEFRKGLIKINDSLYIIGNDTLNIAKGIVSGSFIKNQNTAAQTSSDFWISGTGRMLNLKTDSHGYIGTDNGDAQFSINKTTLNTNQTFYIRQRNSSVVGSPIIEAYNSTGNHVFGVYGNGILLLNGSGGTNTGLNLGAGANVGSIRVTPANNNIEEKMIRIHALANITKTQAVLNLVQLGSNEGAAPIGRFEPISGGASLVNLNVSPYINQTGTASGNVYGVRYNPMDISVQGKSIPFSNTTGSNYFNETAGNTGIGFTPSTTLTARLHIAAGSSSTGTAPVKLTAGTNLTTPENGAVEYDGTNYFVTSNATRYALARTLTTTSVLNFNDTSPSSSTDLTITLTGAANGDPVSLGVPNESVSGNSSFSAWVSAANTVTVRFSNNDLTSVIDPASGTFRVSIIKY